MKTSHIFLAASLLLSSAAANAQHSLTQLWASEATLPVPESVFYSAKNKILYVALIDGKPGEKDGKGGIAKVGLDGKIVAKDWITGLHAPKGMGVMGDKLYVADVTDLVEIDLKSGKILKKHAVEGSVFLNDVTIDAEGNIYVSDSSTKKVHMIKDGKVSTFLEGLNGPNGVLAVGSDLLVADAGTLKKVSSTKEISVLAEGMDKSTDGIEQVVPGEYIVSCWAGVVYYVKSDGTKQELLNTSADKTNSADIGYDSVKKIVYVPTFGKNSVVAYQLK
ncbi:MULTISPECIES: SMP-30/gluconolactonase/LRE family protein [Dyadobacter]|uniref:ATP/GTP-binding protein n=1 Tax=Dyadobacter chenhuakuii TaxID=2909339 RepID=A0A9X1QHK7_9BACT|nr:MULTISPECIES: ATP/GTP-binding protein [Dyadobacter]MCF2500999.1 ATP/GTP-binding protein [Dyadobacter chenhuakuii]MCF2519274.1 ATP/GTP-binding protein [Dyadobacter sp. CY351]